MWGSKVYKRFHSEKEMNLCFNSFLSEGVDLVLSGLSFKDLLPCLKFINLFMNLKTEIVIPRFQRYWGNDISTFKRDEVLWEEFLN